MHIPGGPRPTETPHAARLLRQSPPLSSAHPSRSPPSARRPRHCRCFLPHFVTRLPATSPTCVSERALLHHLLEPRGQSRPRSRFVRPAAADQQRMQSITTSTTASRAESVLVLGAGNFGTCLANHLAALGHDVTVWARNEALAKDINERHRNTRYLPDVELHSGLKAVCDLSTITLGERHVLLFSVPTQHLRSVLSSLRGRSSPFQCANQ
jgi:hypothetical protein